MKIGKHSNRSVGALTEVIDTPQKEIDAFVRFSTERLTLVKRVI